MTELQTELLNILKWFHVFCCQYDLKYYLLGGTMLGAARHQGFIPWDDDVDVGMPRKDYDQLRQMIKHVNNSRYRLETPESDALDYNYCFSKLYDVRTTLVENTKYKTKRGIYLDIFPLDGMGNTERESKRHFALIDAEFKFVLARTTGIRKGRNPMKNLAVVASRAIPNAVINDKALIRHIDKLCQSRDFNQCLYGGNPFGAWRYKEIMPRAIMGKPTLYPFENIEICGVEYPDEYLSRLYGDWRQLPPRENQITHHDYIMLDLHRSYLE